MRHGAGRLDAFQSAINGKNFNYADDNRKPTLTVTLLQDNYLLVGLFVNDNAR